MHPSSAAGRSSASSCPAGFPTRPAARSRPLSTRPARPAPGPVRPAAGPVRPAAGPVRPATSAAAQPLGRPAPRTPAVHQPQGPACGGSRSHGPGKPVDHSRNIKATRRGPEWLLQDVESDRAGMLALGCCPEIELEHGDARLRLEPASQHGQPDRIGLTHGDAGNARVEVGLSVIAQSATQLQRMTTQIRHGQMSQPGVIVVRRHHRLEGLRLERRITGLPVHVLVVHAVVVLLPLAAIATALVAVWAGARRRHGLLALVFTFVATLTVPVATSSGEALAERFSRKTPALRTHTSIGSSLLPIEVCVRRAGVLRLKRSASASPLEVATGTVRVATKVKTSASRPCRRRTPGHTATSAVAMAANGSSTTTACTTSTCTGSPEMVFSPTVGEPPDGCRPNEIRTPQLSHQLSHRRRRRRVVSYPAHRVRHAALRLLRNEVSGPLA